MSNQNSYYEYGDIKLGYGGFEYPPILIGTMFYQGQTLLDRKDPGKFEEEKAKKRIQAHKELSKQYKIPELVEISADTPEAMEKYLAFYLDNFTSPLILGGTFEARIGGLKYLYERNIDSSEFIYNSISNLKNSKEVDLLKKYRIKSIVALILGSPNMTSTQRFTYLTEKTQPGNTSLLEGLKSVGIDRIWIDGGVITLESLAHVLETQQLVSTSLNLPVGTAPNLFLFQYSSPRMNLKFHTRYRRASIMFVASWLSNFIFYGAIEDAKECFASAYQALEFKKITKGRNFKFLETI
jgi:tetrahydromethanopterin S-methyltransferase subunit H